MSDGEMQFNWRGREGKKGNRQTKSEDLLEFHFNSTGSFFSLCAKHKPGH